MRKFEIVSAFKDLNPVFQRAEGSAGLSAERSYD